MAKEKQYRGFTYDYDLGKVKVAKPLPKKIGKIFKKWLEKLDLVKVELILIGKERHDPLSSGSAFSLFKGENILSLSNLDRIRQKDFDLICIILENNAEGNLFKQILGSKGFHIVTTPIFEGIEDILLKDNFGTILADHDQVGDLVYNWINLLQDNRSQSCVILYGENNKAEKISEILQAGVYGFISRSTISNHLYETILG